MSFFNGQFTLRPFIFIFYLTSYDPIPTGRVCYNIENKVKWITMGKARANETFSNEDCLKYSMLRKVKEKQFCTKNERGIQICLETPLLAGMYILRRSNIIQTDQYHIIYIDR